MPRTLLPGFKRQPEEPASMRKRWNLSQCEQMERVGLLPERYELIDGEIYDKMTVNPRHSITLVLFAQWLVSLFGFLHVRTQDPIRLPDQENKPEPDVVVMRQPITSYLDLHPAPSDLMLVAEISDTTLLFDLNDKALLYARAGVVEYWVVDIVGRRIVVHRQPAPEGYREITEYAEQESISTLACSEAMVRVSALLAPLL